MVYCTCYSKGGHLENLTVDPEFREHYLSKLIVNALIQDNSGIITLTTRIPDYFSKYGFRPEQELNDGSIFMSLINQQKHKT
jgi:N-acetylglutamate synthase-like GNAT family acetyltransferase